MIDTHAHIDMCDGTDSEVVANALANGVGRILTIALSAEDFPAVLSIADRHESVFAAVGRHPNSANGFSDADATQIDAAAAHPKVRAIGETGLDFFRDRAAADDQRRAFIAQLEIARKRNLPVSIHARAAVAEVLDVLAEHGDGVTVVMHCFSEPDLLDQIVERGYYCSFAGNVTFKNAPELRAAAALVPDNLLLVETDAPFLAPQPVRGKRNEPANVTMVADTVADVRGISYGQLSDLVEANAKRVFNW